MKLKNNKSKSSKEKNSEKQYGFIERQPFSLEKLEVIPSLKSQDKNKINAKTLYFAICGSDYIHSTSPTFKPRFIGHEWVGVTQDGELITTEVFWGCGKCNWCKKGMDRCCHNKEVFSMGRVGASLLNVSLPIRNISKIDRRLASKFELWLLTTLEPITVGYSIVEDLQNLTSNFDKYENILIIGGGFTGLVMGYLLKSRSIKVKFCEKVSSRKSNLINLGFQIAEKHESEFDIVIDAAGERSISRSSAFEEAVNRVRRCGIVVGSGKYIHSPKIEIEDLQNHGLSIMWPRGGKEGALARLAVHPPDELFDLLYFLKAHADKIFNIINFSDLPPFYTSNNQVPDVLRTIVRVDEQEERI